MRQGDKTRVDPKRLTGVPADAESISFATSFCSGALSTVATGRVASRDSKSEDPATLITICQSGRIEEHGRSSPTGFGSYRQVSCRPGHGDRRTRAVFTRMIIRNAANLDRLPTPGNAQVRQWDGDTKNFALTFFSPARFKFARRPPKHWG